MCSCSCSGSKSGTWEGVIHCVGFDFTENLEKEVINSISMYKTPLYDWKRPSCCFHHDFIVIKTNDCYWSVEKNSVAIIMQKSPDKNIVLKEIDGAPRKPEPFDKEESVEFITLQELVDWIKKNEINNSYCSSVWNRNCQGFAKKAYNFIKESYEQKQKDFSSLYGIGEKKFISNFENLEIDDETETHEFLEFNEMKSEINFSAEINHFFEYKSARAEDNSDFVICFTNDGIYSIEMCEDKIWWKKLNNFTDRVKQSDKLIKDCALKNTTMKDIKKHIEKCKKQYSDVPKFNNFKFLTKSFDFCFKKNKEND